MSNKKIILLQKIFTICIVITSIFLFMYSLYFATPYTDLMLNGSKDMVDAFGNELQVFNRSLYNISIIGVCFAGLLWLCSAGKYFLGKILFPITTIMSVVVVSLLGYLMMQVKSVKLIFDSFNYEVIDKLKDFSIDNFHYVLFYLIASLLLISIIGFISTSSLGFVKLLKYNKGGINDDEN